MTAFLQITGAGYRLQLSAQTDRQVQVTGYDRRFGCVFFTLLVTTFLQITGAGYRLQVLLGAGAGAGAGARTSSRSISFYSFVPIMH